MTHLHFQSRYDLWMVAQRLSLILHKGGLGLHECLHTLLQFIEFFLHWWILERARWSLTGKIYLMIGMVKIVGEIGPERIVLGPREIWVISPTGIVSLRARSALRPWVGRIHVFQWNLMSLKNGTLFKNMVQCLTIWTTRIVNWGGLIWLTLAGFFVSRASILLIRVAILASAAMDDSKDRSPPFDAINCEFLSFSVVGSYCRVFSGRSSNKSHLGFHPFARTPWHMVSNKVFIW